MGATCLAKSDVEEGDGGVTKQSCCESHTGKAAPKNAARCGEDCGRRQGEESEQPRFTVAWAVAMQGADVMALDCIGKIIGYGTWRWSPDCGKKETVEDRMRALSPETPVEDDKTLGCDLCTRGTNSTNKGVTVQLARNDCEIQVCVPLIGQWNKTTLAIDIETTQMHWKSP